jgi:hypothetical protein
MLDEMYQKNYEDAMIPFRLIYTTRSESSSVSLDWYLLLFLAALDPSIFTPSLLAL